MRLSSDWILLAKFVDEHPEVRLQERRSATGG
jgi:hypothetical protein